MTENPYRAPASTAEDPSILHQPTDPESIRSAYLKHEAQVKSIGSLYWIGAFFVAMALFAAPMSALEAEHYVVLALFAVILAAQITLGYGLRRLKAWSRIPSIILSAIGLLAFPLGTIINLFIMIILLSKKSRMVFSPDYQAVISATPHMKYRTSKLVWIALGLVIAIIVVLVLTVAMSDLSGP